MNKKILTLIVSFLAPILLFSQNAYVFKTNSNDFLEGVINNKGQVIISNNFLGFKLLNGYILAKKTIEGSSTLFDKNGKLIIDDVSFVFGIGNNKHILIHEFKPNNQGKWGLFTKTGKKISGYIYDDIIQSSALNNFAQVIKDNQYTLIDTNANIIYQNINKEDFKKYIENFKKLKGLDNDFFNIDAEFVNVNMTKIFKDNKSSKFGLKNGNKIIVNAIYDEIKEMCCNTYVVKKKSKFGVINSEGKIILKPQFDKIQNISNYEIIAELKDLSGVYDAKTGDVIIESKYGFLDFL